MSIKNILNGWQNFISKSEVTEKLAEDRAKVCSNCDDKYYSKTINAFVNDDLIKVKGYICNGCGCPLSAKIRSTNEKCPLNKW